MLVYAMDMGNGFTKRTSTGQVIIEPSIRSNGIIMDSFGEGADAYDVIEINGDQFYVGNDAKNSGKTVFSIVGDDDTVRYNSSDFKKTLLGFIAKDFVKFDEMKIDTFVTGLPVSHFKKKRDDLKEIIQGEHIVKINGQEIVIKINRVVVVPQPVGTYMNLLADRKINAAQHVLIVDGGYGTLDITSMKEKSIVENAGAAIGVKNAYIGISKMIQEKFDVELKLIEIPYVLENGLKVDGETFDIMTLEETREELKRQFDEVYTFVRENRFDLKLFDKVVWTGGMSLLYREFISDKGNKNFRILQDAQIANVQGYFDYGRAISK